jgi:hypothetical protein
MVSKSSPPKPKKTAGRRPGPPEDVRTERLVVRMHPDLVESLTERAKVYGVSRSTYVERILIGYLNMQEGQKPLDGIGRYLKTAAAESLKSAGAPGDEWRLFGKRNLRLLGIQAERAAALRYDEGLTPNPDDED